MDRKLVVVLPQLSEALRDRIRAAAEKNGFRAVFPQSFMKAVPEIQDAEIILGGSSELSKRAPKLKWFCAHSAGVEHLLAPGAFANPDALLTNSSGAYGVTIAEHVVMVTLEMMRRRTEYDEIVRSHRWVRDLHIHSIHGSRIAFLGTGDIGRECAKRMRAFGPVHMTGISRQGEDPGRLFDRTVTADRLDSVLPETDLLIASLPDTAETRGMLNAERLSILPETAYLVNVGRGSVLDQKALETMLREGRLAGAALDVFAEEPIPASDPLWNCPGLIITPHIAGNMTLDYTLEKIAGQFLEDLDNYACGRPLSHLVDRQREY